MIIHSPIISGSLTFAEGASATLPSSTSYSGSFLGTVNATNGIVSGSIQILGGSTVLSSSAQNFTEFSSSVASTFAGLSTDYNDLQNIPSGIISSSGQIDDLFNIDGVLSSSNENFTSYSSSVDSRILTEKGRIDSILDSADADKDSFAEIVTLINSVDTTNDNAFASFYTSSNNTNDAQDARLTSLEAETGSITTEQSAQDSRLSNLETETGSITTEQAAQDSRLSNLESVTSSYQATLSVSDTTNVDMILSSDTLSANLKGGVVSGSIQILGGSTVLSSSNQNFTEFSSSVASTFAGLSTDYNDLQNIPSGIISSSAQIDDLFNIDGVVSGSEQIVDVLASLNTYTASNDTTNSTQNSRLDQLSTETGSITTEQSAQDSRLTQLETKTGSLDSTNTAQNSRLSNLEAETGSITTEQSSQDGRLSNLESFTSSLDTDLATLSVPANTTISTFGKSLVDDADAATARTTLGVDEAGTDNSTDVTLAGSYDYITISGQTITRNQITNDDLAGSIANAKLANSSITISGTSVSLGGSITDETLFGGTTLVSGSATQVRTFLNVEDGADVTDTANVTAAGALMDSEVDADIKTLSLPANTTISTFGASLVDDADAATARTTLGVDAAGTDNSTDVTLVTTSHDYLSITGQAITLGTIQNNDLANSTITINGNSTALGGSYSVTAADVGLGNVTNESKATMFTNAALTGAPTAPTQIGTDDSTKIATTAFVQDRIDTIIGNAGSTLDTLGELSASLSDDQDSLSALTTTVGTKLAKASNLSDLTNAATARTNLGVAIGSDVQAYNATLAAVAGGTYTGDDSITTVGTIGTGTWQGTAIGDSYISSAGTWNAKLDSAGTIATNDYAKYDANGDLVGRSYSEVKTDLSLNNVENTAVSTWAGSSNITTLGTISTGTWQGSAISTTYIQNTSGTNTGDEPDASTTVKGIVELATTAETTTGTDTTRAVTPDGLKDGYQGSTNVTTLGTITTGVWNGTAIANENLANSTISGISLGSNLASLSAGTGVSLTAYNGSTARTISIGQSVGTSDTVQFGKVGVGTAADATYELKVSGDIGATGDIVAYISSDERLKDNIELISNPIEKVQSLRGVTWEWNDNASEAAKESPNVGVIAQDLEKVLPQLVHDRESGYKGVDYAKLTGLLIEAIKEQQKQIDDLKSKLG